MVGTGLRALSPERARGGPVGALLSPAEPPLPGGAPVTAIAVNLPRRDLPLGWLAGFCLGSILGGLAAKPWLRVEI